MKRVALVLLLLLIIPSAVRADDASKRAKVEDLIQLTKMDQLMGKMVDQMSTRIKAMTAQQTANLNATPEQQKLIDDYQTKIQQIVKDSVSWDKMKPVIVEVYSETYTDEELDGILAFYRSPSGRALVAKSPELMTRVMNLMQKQMIDLQPQMQQANEDFTRKMKELEPPPASNAPSPSQKP